MKEVTEIITAQITVIKKGLDADDVRIIEESKAEKEELTATTFKNFYGADDVRVTIKDFIREVD